MRKAWPLLALLPGLGVAALGLAGLVPTARDGPSYFVPLRARTAHVLRGEKSPWLISEVGCGEPFFANPQSSLLYPPGWLAVLLPPAKAVAVEVGLHLAWLGLGVWYLSQRLGGGPWGGLAAAWGVQASGPALSAAGMLNNLETAAWLPWICEAALAGRGKRLALALALSFFAAEPTLALLGVLGALLLAPEGKTIKALLVGLGLAAAQLVPMGFWIAGGDRGPQKPLEAISLGGVSWQELPALLVPGFPLAPAEVRFLPLLTLPAWAFLALLFSPPKEASHRRLLFFALACLSLAVLPTLPWGDALWLALSFGYVRLPGRFVLPASVALLALAGSRPWPRRPLWLALAGLLGLAGGLVSHAPQPALLQAALAALVPWANSAAAAGSLALAAYTLPVLELRPWQPQPVPCLAAQRGGRLFTLPVDAQQIRWAHEHGCEGPGQLAWGYSALLDGRQPVRSHGPLVNRALVAHLQEADKGPEKFWWVSALGATRILSLRPIPGYPVLCHEGDLWVLANPWAFPPWGLARLLPQPEQLPQWVGRVEVLQQGSSSWSFRLSSPEPAFFLWLFAPDKGFRFFLDGNPVSPVKGAGIVQGIPVPQGTHGLLVLYRPPGLTLGLGLFLLALVGMAWPRWS